ncbi:MAG: type II secretory pathway component PulC [Myxococcota bacterium]|jgi:type II secretory pathway component PulC
MCCHRAAAALVLAACSSPPPDDAGLPMPEHPSQVASVPVPPKSVYLDAITGRSIFDSEKVGGMIAEEDGDEALTELPLLLLGTVLADPSALSSALIAVLDERGRPNSAQGYGVGAVLIEGVTLARITQREVTLRLADGQLERLPISDDVERSRPVPAAVLRSAIQRRGRRNYILDDDTFSAASADSIVDGVQLSGDSKGVRLLRASRSTPLYKMGLRSRDIVRTVNGQAVDEPGELKEALRDAVEDEQQFSIVVERRRRERTLRYTLQ